MIGAGGDSGVVEAGGDSWGRGGEDPDVDGVGGDGTRAEGVEGEDEGGKEEAVVGEGAEAGGGVVGLEFDGGDGGEPVSGDGKR